MRIGKRSNERKGEKRMRRVSTVSRNGCEFTCRIRFRNGCGRIISYFKPDIYIYIYFQRIIEKKNTTHSNHYAIELFIVHKIRKDLENWITLDFMLASKLRIIWYHQNGITADDASNGIVPAQSGVRVAKREDGTWEGKCGIVWR